MWWRRRNSSVSRETGGGVMVVYLCIKRDLKMAKNGSEGHPIRERAGLGLFLGLSDVVTDEIGQVKRFVLKNAPN